jgi:hypothetical protein
MFIARKDSEVPHSFRSAMWSLVACYVSSNAAYIALLKECLIH